MLCFSMICGSAGSKSNLVKAAGAEVAFQLGNEREAHLQVKIVKN